MSTAAAERRVNTRAVLVALGVITLLGCGGRARDESGRAMAAAGASGVGGAAVVGEGSAGTSSGGTPAGSTAIPGFLDLSREELDALLEQACAGETLDGGEPVQLTRLFLVDASETMSRMASGFAQSDWDFARFTVKAAGPSLFPGSATGLSFFPNRPTMPHFGEALAPTECVDPSSDVEIALGEPSNPEQWPVLLSALSAVAPVSGAGAPLFDAYRSAAASLAAASPEFSSERVLALITDGQPTLGFGCVGADDVNAPLDPEPLIREIEQARSRLGVQTLVVGTPGSASTVAGLDARPWLSRAARAGGPTSLGCTDQGPKYCHYDIVSRPDLTHDLPRAMGRMGNTSLACTYSFGEPPPGESLDAFRISFIYWTLDGEPKLVVRNSQEACGVGYRIVSQDVPRLEVCPETCEAMRADGGQLQLLFGCNTLLPPGL